MQFSIPCNNLVVNFKKIMNMLWPATLIVMASMVLGKLYIPSQSYSRGLEMKIARIYESVFKVVWVCCVSFVIYACTTTKPGWDLTLLLLISKQDFVLIVYLKGIVSKIFAWPFWKPLSKLSYSVYLVHTTVILFMIYTSDRPLHANKYNAVWF